MNSQNYRESLRAEQERRDQAVRLNKIMYFERQLATAQTDEERTAIERTLSVLRYGSFLASASA